MYENKPLRPTLNNKCSGCKYCVFDNERLRYGCRIYGCIDNAFFVEFNLEDFRKEKEKENEICSYSVR